MNRRLQLNLY